jgi:NhaP-type Na+/H+ or K+/H+ antiporter
VDTLSTIENIIRDLLIFVAVMVALLIILIVVVSKMPSDNPLKRVLTALCYRIGATAAAGALAVPVEPIPGLDALYDIGVPILLIWYWFTFFRDTGRTMSRPPAAPPQQGRIAPDKKA